MNQEKDPFLVAGCCLLDWERYRVVLDGKFLALPLKRLRLLEIFLANADRVLSRDEIRRHLWNSELWRKVGDGVRKAA
jgi:DNA-binding response OmpR family regulator